MERQKNLKKEKEEREKQKVDVQEADSFDSKDKVSGMEVMYTSRIVVTIVDIVGIVVGVW